MPSRISAVHPPTHRHLALLIAWLALPGWALAADIGHTGSADSSIEMPWRQAGLTERQAAAHLLDRFTFGARPGDLDRVLAIGLETWFEQQLDGGLATPELDRFLEGLATFELDALELARRYPSPGAVRRMAIQEGVIESPEGDTAAALPAEGSGTEPRKRAEQRRAVRALAEEKGFGSQREALADLMIQKLARARHSENQLHEVLTDFWFNHFNVSLTDNRARIFLWPYERDAIRPHVAGSFHDMLGATARHPAMLLYLDNALSVAEKDTTTTWDLRSRRASERRGRRGINGPRRAELRDQRQRDSQGGRQRATGLNENYARELMELHTLGVDGGYTQEDVVEVARSFTGWTVVPPRGLPERLERARAGLRTRAGFVIENAFLFRPDAHDAERKLVLGRELPAGRGVEDGEDVLDLLANHPSTAQHLSTKLAIRFVSDQPPRSLIDRLAKIYQASGGDIRAMLAELVASPEFWSADSIGQKIKSPFELTISALRALDAHSSDPRETLEWIRRMGQPLYAYQAPTGFPDRAEAWVNTGALLQRMNFGLQLATGRVAGIRVELDRYTGHPPDETSPEEQLRHWLTFLIPERDPEPTMRRLLPVIQDPDLADKVARAAPDDDEDNTWNPLAERDRTGGRGTDVSSDADWDVTRGPGRRDLRARRAAPATHPDDSFTAHVVGVILGSPEFQRR
ncbi:MAG: DUF1800 domain-containing protein [Thermoanaerobaculia bacterium]|nr:DUF1800 domain-containing protein [Thermoanaerobaculia bacterium]